MKIKYIISFIIIGLMMVGSVVNAADIQYPVKELGNCKSRADCKLFCDKPVNTDACLDFAGKNNMMSAQEIDTAKKFLAADNAPGGCKTKDSCDEYCNNIKNINECVSFAEKNNLISPQELEEAKKVQSAINKGVKPPACGNKKECDIYCEDPNHMEECVNFGIAAGFIQGKELEDSQKMLVALKKGVKPPPCKGKDACDQYCSSPDNMETCMNFAMEAGMMSEQEKENSQKMLAALKKGIKPPPCKGKEECDVFCSSEEHSQECINFSVAAGMMSEEEATVARKTGGKGPGGCVGRDACDTFCNNPDNQETCFNFAKDNGMIPKEGLQNMQDGQPGQNQQGQNQPQNELKCSPKGTAASFVCAKNGRNANTGGPETTYFNSCTAKQAGAEIIHEGVCEGHNPCGSVADPVCGNDGNTWVSACYADESGGGVKYEGACKNPSGQQKTQQNREGQNQQGQSEDKFQPGSGTVNPSGQRMPQQAGPGGCKGPEECQKYCASNPEVCKNFQPQQNQQGQPNQQNQPGQKQGQGDPNQPNSRLPQQQPGQPNQGDTSGSGACGTGPGTCSGIGPDDINQQNQSDQMQPQQQQPQQQQQNPPPPSSFIINTDSFVGSLISAVFKFLTKH